MTDRAELIDDLRQFFTYTDEEQQDIVDKAIAALEAKPEPAKPLPESEELDWLVHDWIKSAVGKPLIRDEAVYWFRKVFDKIDELHSQHQAELELLRSKLALVLRENRRLSDELKKVDAELAAAKEQGRREALQVLSGLQKGDCFCDIGIGHPGMSNHSPQCIAATAFIESACDAQEKP